MGENQFSGNFCDSTQEILRCPQDKDEFLEQRRQRQQRQRQKSKRKRRDVGTRYRKPSRTSNDNDIVVVLIAGLLLLVTLMGVASSPFSMKPHHHRRRRRHYPNLQSTIRQVKQNRRRQRQRWGEVGTPHFYRHSRETRDGTVALAIPFTGGGGGGGDGINSTMILAQSTVAALSYFGLIAVFDRPKGQLFVNADDLRVARSQVEGAGLGLFVTKSLPKDTILGTYPGVVSPLQESLSKVHQHPECERYIWRFTDNVMIVDPTDRGGQLQNVRYGGSTSTFGSVFFMENVIGKFTSVSTVLARINEPPLGMDCNVYTEEDLQRRQVVFVLSRDVYEGEELFMDYGLSYDRSGYGSGSGGDGGGGAESN